MNNNNTQTVDKDQGCVKLGVKRVWKFVHEEDYEYQSKLLERRTCDFNWLSISKDGTVKVKGSRDNGYAWDGCTPKCNFLHITWGNFDGRLKRFSKGDYKPYTYYASMIHDAIYQYKRCVPVTRKEADKIFYQMLKDSGYIWAWVYYVGVRLFGWWFRGWKYKSTEDIELIVA